LHSLKVSLKIIISFLFSLVVLLTFLTVSLFGVQARDTVRLIVTEATGLQRDMVVLSADLQPLVIHNVFWLCIASFGFMLIFMYFIDHKFRDFLGPAVLSLAITLVLFVVISVSADYILRFVGPSTDMYIETAFYRFRQAVVGMTAFGIVLTAIALRGDQLFKKAKKK